MFASAPVRWPGAAVGLALALHVLAMATTWPAIPINTDETMYLNQTVAMA